MLYRVNSRKSTNEDWRFHSLLVADDYYDATKKMAANPDYPVGHYQLDNVPV